jgi:hypothetical protein
MKMSDYVETEIGEFPKDWEAKRLSEIAEPQRGLSYIVVRRSQRMRFQVVIFSLL